MTFQNGNITFLSQCKTSTCSRSACAPVGVLNWHSVITNSIIFFQISYIESKKNRQNSSSLNMPFWHVCTELLMLSTNFLDSTRIYSSFLHDKLKLMSCLGD